MYRSTKPLLLAALLSCTFSTAAQGFANVGRAATPAEIAAWDIDVRPDFKGLPPGSGSVQKGQQVWDEKCASCHGTFGESNEVFTPIVGGTTKEDIVSGRVAALAGNKQPQRTTLMKLSTLSTLWDYIRRAMPWTAPKTLTNDEVYAVTAYILYLGEIVPEDFTLSNHNIADTQKLIPNRNGTTLAHGMRDIGGKPDVQASVCMQDCVKQVEVRSSLPDVARPAHGNLQQQNRQFGAVRGADTLKPALMQAVGDGSRRDRALLVAANSTVVPAENFALAKQFGCTACHGVTNKMVGPAFTEIAARYHGKQDAAQQLAERVRKGSAGNWGSTPMPAQTQPSDAQLAQVVGWILAGAK